ncbi:hypothetical protein D3C74_441240 [compost metagenome]
MNFRLLVGNQITAYSKQPPGGNPQMIIHTKIVTYKQVALRYIQIEVIVGYDLAHRHFFIYIHRYIGVDIHIPLNQHPRGIDLKRAPIVSQRPGI